MTTKPKNLSALFDPALPMITPWGETVLIPPPSKEDGLIMSAFYAAMYQHSLEPNRCPMCGSRDLDTGNENMNAILDAAKDRPVEEVALSRKVYDYLISNGISDGDLTKMGFYALTYWIIGEEAADEWVASSAGKADGEAADPAPKA